MRNTSHRLGGNEMKVEIAGEATNEIAKRVSILLTTPKGTVCYDRGFGVDLSVLDMPLPIARVKYLADCVEQVKRYEPSLAVSDVEITFQDGMAGEMMAKVVITHAG